jgi:YjbE family integral membrane protein
MVRMGYSNGITKRGRDVDFLFANFTQMAFWLAVLQIIGVNIILSGDNAVVIAMACRGLPPHQRLWGMVLGAGVAVLLRILFTMVVAQAMAYPYLKLAGGVLLLWVAVKLVVPDEPDEDGVKAADNLWRAVWIVTIAETAASAVDPANAVVVKATLIIFGLATSVPLIVAGSALLMALLERFPILVWGGGALLGWVAGDIITKDDALLNIVSAERLEQLHYWAAAAGALFVLGMGYLLTRGRRAAEKQV